MEFLFFLDQMNDDIDLTHIDWDKNYDWLLHSSELDPDSLFQTSQELKSSTDFSSKRKNCSFNFTIINSLRMTLRCKRFSWKLANLRPTVVLELAGYKF